MSKEQKSSLPHGELLKWGLYYGLMMGMVAVAGWFVTLLLTEKSLWQSLVSMSVYLLEFFIIYWAVRKYKTTHKEFVFFHGLMLALYTGLISGLILAAYIILYYYVINPHALEAWFEVRRTELEREFKDNPDKVNDILDFTRSFYIYIVLAGSVTGQFFIALLSGLSSSFIFKDQEVSA
jgi:hypothetical protein